MLVMRSNFLENLINSSWDHTSVLEIWGWSVHCKSLTCTCLSIAHDGTIVSSSNSLDNVLCTVGKDIFLWWVVHDFVKFELPWFLLIINETSICILWNMDSHMLQPKYIILVQLRLENKKRIHLVRCDKKETYWINRVDLDVLASKIRRWSCPDDNLDWLFRHLDS